MEKKCKGEEEEGERRGRAWNFFACDSLGVSLGPRRRKNHSSPLVCSSNLLVETRAPLSHLPLLWLPSPAFLNAGPSGPPCRPAGRADGAHRRDAGPGQVRYVLFLSFSLLFDRRRRPGTQNATSTSSPPHTQSTPKNTNKPETPKKRARSLRMYNSLVERCFKDCVDSFRRKDMEPAEEKVR